MQRINTRDFKAHSGKYTDMALSEPVVIQKHRRDSVVIISYEAYSLLEQVVKELEDLKLSMQIKEIKASGGYINKEESVKRLMQMINDEE